jgi:hypothetical protein
VRLAGAAAIVVLLMCGCTSWTQAAAKPSASHQEVVGGCAGTVLTQAEPPVWAQGGWSHVVGTPWPVPWAMATPGDAVAYLMAGRELVEGSSMRSDSTSNKVLWVTEDPVAFVVEGRPLGETHPVVTVSGGPSIVDLPAAGCWTFQLLRGKRTSVINLEVLPAAALP